MAKAKGKAKAKTKEKDSEYAEAYEALQKMHSDMSVSRGVAKRRLEKLRDEIDEMLSVLESEMDEGEEEDE
jgi:hypothetical protein